MVSDSRIIISISSDIGYELALDWLKKGSKISGTYRTKSDKTKKLKKMGVTLVRCDLSRNKSINKAIMKLRKLGTWDVITLAAGTQKPVGLFEDIDFQEWRQSIKENFLGQFEILHGILSLRNKVTLNSTVICFAGGGTNNATTHYSSYTVSKIASIKFCELLDAEILDTKFTILGPGWIKTKIHNETLKAGVKAGENFLKTKSKIEKNDMESMQNVVDCVNWVIQTPKSIVSGRNFSVVNDPWREVHLGQYLLNDIHAYKLRRYKNEYKFEYDKER
jgi:NADP-dependent 3-hydroxy acid dehydrogenase YdfG